MQTFTEDIKYAGQPLNLLDGAEHIVFHSGTSQYGKQTGTSSCGLAALNFARVVFARVADGEPRYAVLSGIVARATVTEITAICAGWTGTAHLEVEDISQIPLFEKSLELLSTTYGRPSLKEFRVLLQNLQVNQGPCVVVITRPPEIIACLKVDITGKCIFVVFDSHPRPEYPDGAGIIVNASLEGTAHRLCKILPVDNDLLTDRSLQWQAQLLGNFSGHIFTPKLALQTKEDLTHTIIETSLALLALRAEIVNLKFQNECVVSDNKRLEAEIDEMEEEKRKKKDMARTTSHNTGRSTAYASGQSSKAPLAASGSSQRGSLNSSSTIAPNWNQELHNAYISSNSLASSALNSPRGLGNHASTSRDETDIHMYNVEANGEEATRQQRIFDEEDQLLRRQQEELTKHAQRVFNCGVCFEEYPEDFIARLDPCSHAFCRDCIRGHISSKLNEHCFPIICPICMTAKCKGKVAPGTVNIAMAQEIGITEKQYEIWNELVLVEFSVLLHCPKCKRSAFVDRQDLEDTRTLACPLPNCNYIWCKLCQQAITIGDPQHSCDGSSELDHLMKQSGWRHCPNCKTPYQKTSGCNHMTCLANGCNTHFCYIDGGLIIKSALRSEIKGAVSAHYRKCQLFQDIPDRGAPP